MEGPASILWGMLAVEGWLSFFPIQMVALGQLLPEVVSDQVVWRFAQAHGMILLTGGHCLEAGDELEQMIRTELGPRTLPVLTVKQVSSLLNNRYYQEHCLDSLLEVFENVERYRGVGRIFIPQILSGARIN